MTLPKLNIFGQFSFEVATSIIGIFAVFIIYGFVALLIKKQSWSNEKKRRNIISVRNLFIFLYIVFILVVWSGEIKTFALSAAAIVAAFLVSFKELLLSFVGSVISNKTFRIGDYIEYDGIKGKIIDKNFVNTTVLISDKFTSKELIFPNLSYITNKVINLSSYGKFQVYKIKFSVERQEELIEKSKICKEIADSIINEQKEKVDLYFKNKQSEDVFFDVPKDISKISIDISDQKNPYFTLHYISHALDKDDTEDQIVQKYLESISKIDNKSDV